MEQTQGQTNSATSLLVGLLKTAISDTGEGVSTRLEFMTKSKTNSFEDIKDELNKRKRELVALQAERKKQLKTLLQQISDESAELAKVNKLLSNL